ncbi:CDP-glycerol glycerophosphotransferase family protein [Exiguobacterium sp. SH3S2]|uniref:CDP-glycerol glycerophosphotransferase family protein n=1 Tax=Exiguobacterium sp. SH3S2 TaxID=2510956 RepID=UPI001F364349|nr:CDP-glycerol glycerophosphotransferase family protein [Exiguobacterium sp. SH3S2]
MNRLIHDGPSQLLSFHNQWRKTFNGRDEVLNISDIKEERYNQRTMSFWYYKINVEVETVMKLKIRRLIFRCVEYGYRFMMIISQRILPKQDIVMFESFLGKQYSDSPKAIYEEWKSRKESRERLIWSVDRRCTEEIPSNVEYVVRLSLKWVYFMSVSKIWISNSRLPNWLPKDKRTIYLQTWHGTPLKKLALDMNAVHMPGTNTDQYKASFKRESSKWDYLISPNRYSSEIFRSAFAFDKTMLEVGYPRNDLFYNQKKLQKVIVRVKNELNLPKEKKVILYAPTWRDQQNEGRGQYRLSLPLDFEKFVSKFGDDYVLLVRFHYLVSENLDLSNVSPHVLDVSSYPDIAELYTISDVLITDYSSVMFDFAHLKRPMLFYVYDLEEYRDDIRGFYMNFTEEAPGPLMRTEEELYQTLEAIESVKAKYQNKLEKFNQRFCEYDNGNAAASVVEILAADLRE